MVNHEFSLGTLMTDSIRFYKKDVFKKLLREIYMLVNKKKVASA